MSKRTITISIENEVFNKVITLSEKENRGLSNMIETLLIRQLK